MRTRKTEYYAIKHPMNVFQKKAHLDAMHRTADFFKATGMTVTQEQIMKVLRLVHMYIVHLATNMSKRTVKGYASVSKVKIGYFRTIYPKLFTDMHNNGEFTDAEFSIIRNEFYKKEFDIYYKLLKQRKQWIKQNLK